MFDYLVIGKGLFGSAAAKYLSRSAAHVAILGPDEPVDKTAHEGVFASHYDQGRLAGRLGRGAVWTELADRSLRVYRQIEAESGIRFYTPTGRLHAPASSVPADYAAAMTDAYDLTLRTLSSAEQEAAYPYLRFPGVTECLVETPPAGYINPRALIQAQLAIAARQGAAIIRETAAALIIKPDYVQVQTRAGTSYQARKVLIAAGAFSNFIQLEGPAIWPLPLRLKTETILLAETTAAEAQRLRSMPATTYEIDSPVLRGIYLLPPLRYPDGRYYAKLGCDTAADRFPTAYEDVIGWFKYGDSDRYKAELLEALLAILPGLRVTSHATARCIVTYTPHGRPFIDEISAGRVYTAVGGNGTGAKSSDAIGHLAADLVLRGSSRADFAIQDAV